MQHILAKTFATLATIIGAVVSQGEASYRPPNAKCWDYQVPVTISAGYYSFTSRFLDQQGLTEFVALNVARTPGAATLDVPKDPLSSSPVNKTNTYSISATFCTPQSSCPDTVILATHGLGFDRSYWNLAYEPDQHNFAQHAIDKGYAVFFYDRLGVGNSTRVSGWSAQLLEQVEIAAELARLIKAGKFTGNLSKSPKVAMIGHSFGSAVCHGVAAYSPELIDAVILTGYGMNSSGLNFNVVEAGWSLRVANDESNFQHLGLDAGYVVWADLWTNILTFFKRGHYELSAAQYSEAHKTPFGILEMFSAVEVPPTFPIPKFTGPVMLISGEFDFIFCDGNCNGILHEPAVEVFSASSDFVSYIQPGFSHGMNFHTNATGFFGVMTAFLTKNGL